MEHALKINHFTGMGAMQNLHPAVLRDDNPTFQSVMPNEDFIQRTKNMP